MISANLGRAREAFADRPWRQLLAATAIFAAASLYFFGRQTLADPSHTCVCADVGDPSSYMWSLGWWVHAVSHGLNPFLTKVLYVPDTVTIGATGLAPGAGFLAIPITAIAGPMISYDVVMLAAPVLAGVSTYV